MVNMLYYGDNLHYLRELPSESVDLIYLDPPFNSQATYNLLFRTPDGTPPEAQTTAFKDTWSWNRLTDDALDDVAASGSAAASLLEAFHSFLGHSDLMAYLCMMAVRLIEIRRILRPTGCIYLHCDPTSSHYLKILLDGTFGAINFTNDISWKRTTTKSDYRQGARNWPRIHDTILHYARNIRELSPFHQPFADYSQGYVDSKYRNVDAYGRRYMLDNLTAPGAGSRGHPRYEFLGITRYWRYNESRMRELFEEGRIVQPRPGAVPRYKRYLDEVRGVALGDFWDDIPAINSQAKERTGYPTQKPLSLLTRIIEASSKVGDIVLDPFCGCGTTIEAAEKLQRQWIGIDITTRAIEVIEGRLTALKKVRHVNEYQVKGRPDDLESARRLAEDKYEFQWWATWLLGAQNYRERKKGADAGVDGIIYFKNGPMGIGQN